MKISLAILKSSFFLLLGTQVLKGSACNLIQERLAKFSKASTPYDSDKLVSALNWVALRDPNLIAFLSRFDGLAQKREAIRREVQNAETAYLAEILVVQFELTQAAAADKEAASQHAPRKIPELMREYDKTIGITLGGSFVNLILTMRGQALSDSSQNQMLKNIFKLSFDNHREMEIVQGVLDSSQFAGQFTESWTGLSTTEQFLPKVRQAFRQVIDP